MRVTIEIFAVALAAVGVGVLVMTAYRQGLKDGRALDKGEPIEPVMEKPVFHKPNNPDKQAEKWAQILGNVDRYDGTEKGQKKVSE